MSDPVKNETLELTREIRINASPEMVFTFLTQEIRMKEWLAEIVEIDPQPGGVFHIGTADGIHCRGKFLEVVPDQKVVFTWGGIEKLDPGESTVEIILKPEGQGTHLTLRHYNIRLKPSAESFGEGWECHALPRLKEISEGRTPDGVCFSSGNDCEKS